MRLSLTLKHATVDVDDSNNLARPVIHQPTNTKENKKRILSVLSLVESLFYIASVTLGKARSCVLLLQLLPTSRKFESQLPFSA